MSDAKYDLSLPELPKDLEIKVGHIPAEPQYLSMSTDKLKQLAMDVIDGKVFGSWMLRNGDERLLPNIFMTIMFMPAWWEFELRRDKIVHFYEFESEASPRGINGYPCFFSMRLLDQDDSRKLESFMKKISVMRQEFMNDSGENNDHA